VRPVRGVPLVLLMLFLLEFTSDDERVDEALPFGRR